MIDWLVSASEWARQVLENAGTSPAALPLAFLLGAVSALASACCALPVFGVIVGYGGTRAEADRRSRLIGAGLFMAGVVLALFVLGSVAALVGQAAQAVLGRYWQAFAGVVAIIAGLATLGLIPFKLPHSLEPTRSERRGLVGALAAGLIMGGAVSVCSLGCNPAIFIIVGVAVIQGYTLWMFGVLVAYAVGFSVPLTALMLGASFGAAAIQATKLTRVVRIVAGVVLIAAGFYFLASL